MPSPTRYFASALLLACLWLPGCDRAAREPSAQALEADSAGPSAPARDPVSPDVTDTAAPASQVGRVCPDPDAPCPGFREHDLSFTLPNDGVARAELSSQPFFAVLLRSGAACSIGEDQRRAVQAAFPGRKVFAHRFGCDDDVENNVTYSGVDRAFAFLAVYAGGDRAEADSTLAAVTASGAYPGANLRRMQVTFVSP
jgi:hypothetical protein